MRLLVFSDSHGSRKNMDQVFATEQYDVAVHLGDHMLPRDYMDAKFDYWVAGNNDDDGQEHLIFTVDGIVFLALHGHHFFSFTYQNWLRKMAKYGEELGAAVVLFGHSHFPDQHKFGPVTVANPGSIAQPRYSHPLHKAYASGIAIPTYMVITTTDGNFSFELKEVA